MPALDEKNDSDEDDALSFLLQNSCCCTNFLLNEETFGAETDWRLQRTL